nr:GBS Bsp-like repeat-containing protein [Paenibacillus pasadenensis]
MCFGLVLVCSIFLVESIAQANSNSSFKYYEYDNGVLSFAVVQKNSEFYKTVYSYDNNGRVLSKKTSKISKVDSPGIVDLSAASFDVYAYNVPESAEDVRFPTWTESQGQDDLENPWILGRKVSKGVWKVTIPFSKHFKENGSYLTHVYVDSVMYGEVTTKVQRNATQAEAPDTVPIAEKSYEIKITGVPLQVNRVVVPTWSDINGQDDLEWIPADKIGDGIWSATISLINHRDDLGKYYSHIYYYDKYGNSIHIEDVAVNVTRPAIASKKEVDLSASSFDVYAYGVDQNVQNVYFPTWTLKNGQDDMRWPGIQGVNMGNGTWKATIPFSKHFNEAGEYVTHVYVDGVYVGGTATTVKKGTQVTAPFSVSLGTRYYEVRVTGVPQNITQVEIPTWSDHNGQDDLDWVPAVYRGNGTWSAVIDIAKHNNDTGPYFSHVYYYNASGERINFEAVAVNVY